MAPVQAREPLFCSSGKLIERAPDWVRWRRLQLTRPAAVCTCGPPGGGTNSALSPTSKPAP